MELVGKEVRKEFKGHGFYKGMVQSFDQTTGFYEILYEDGDSEEVDFSEVSSLLLDDSHGGVDRKQRTKRRRIDPLRTGNNSCGVSETLGVRNGGLGFNLDLNAEINFNLNDGFDLNEAWKGRGCIDLNLDLNGVEEEEEELRGGAVETRKRECGFDLNLEFGEEAEEDETSGECGGEVKEGVFVNVADGVDLFVEEGCGVVEKSDGGEVVANGGLVEVCVYDGSFIGSVGGVWKEDVVCGDGYGASVSVEVLGDGQIEEDFNEVVDGSQGVVKTARRGRGRPRGAKKRVADLDLALKNLVLSDVNYVKNADTKLVTDGYHGEGGSSHRVLRNRRRGRRKLSENSISATEATFLINANSDKDYHTPLVIDGNQAENGSADKEVSNGCRKRRKTLDSGIAMAETVVLRRSARRRLVKGNTSVSPTSIRAVDSLQSPSVIALTEEKPVKSCHQKPVEPVVLPPMVLLPPSSLNPNLSGLPVLDIFSIYACLRSFSMLLFLSPFEFEDFVEALRSEFPNSLIDCIHVSILQTLKKHLEHLSNEGSEYASDCLRNLNWDFLDVLTWPVFMVEYFVVHGSGLKPELDLCRLKLLSSDYYKQPMSVKVEILCWLCDDMIEVEAIRSELNRRSLGVESELDFDKNMSVGTHKKRRAEMDVSGASCVTEEATEETTDWNSDECCLCKMDGSLICCDGCPAAYHSKCVGIGNDSLPDGDWYCPECAIGRLKPWLKTRNSLRGADLLGVDPYGRLYFSSCDFLLVSDSGDVECSFSYYNRDDLYRVVEVLKSLQMYYSSILESICKHWDIPISLYGASGNLNSLNQTLSLHTGIPHAELASSEICVVNNVTVDTSKLEKKFVIGLSHQYDGDVSKSVSPTCLSSEGSAETAQVSSRNQGFQKEGPGYCSISVDISNQQELLGNYSFQGDNSSRFSSSDVRQESMIASAATGCNSSAVNPVKTELLKPLLGTGYVNYYSFGHTAALVVEELLQKPTGKIVEETIKSDEEVISAQMKIISKRFARFYWPNVGRPHNDALKEKCGWCFYCRFPSDDSDCLFNLSLGPMKEGSLGEVVELEPRGILDIHLKDLVCYMLMLEDRLQGLLLGPWLDPHFSNLWRKCVQKAYDLVSVKRLLLMLELNLHRLALAAEWQKYVDSAVTVGSASHVVINLSRASAKNNVGRKRARNSDQSRPSSKSTGGLSMLWWRGGRHSRQLFSWKVLPYSLASKAARQAGCLKIPGVTYPDNSDPAKRSKSTAWRAAVESSTTLAQLALQVRDLDSNIRWNEIDNTRAMSILDKEFRKSVRHFKKAIIRRKCKEGTKYLLDFGKRKIIPEVVSKNGSMVEESSSERKKYWLDESYVPLHLLKAFEEKRISRISSKLISGKLSETDAVLKMPSKKRGFSYLFAKAERSEYHRCGHCNKDVPIREAVCCQHCKGYFHKRHVQRSGGSITSKCTYMCRRCADGNHGKLDKKKGKLNMKKGKSKGKKQTTKSKKKAVLQQKSKNAYAGGKSIRLRSDNGASRISRALRSYNKKKVTVVPLRRSARKTNRNQLQMQNKFQVPHKRVGRRKKKKHVKYSKGTPKKPKRGSLWKKKRSLVYHSYWLNGLLLSRKPDDERVKHFKRKGFLGPFENVIPDQPKCHLCHEAGYMSSSSYISCEICGEWFHGDAFGLGLENMSKLIGFRCHVCRKKNSPFRPCGSAMRGNEPEMGDAQNDVGDVSEESIVNEENEVALMLDESFPARDN